MPELIGGGRLIGHFPEAVAQGVGNPLAVDSITDGLADLEIRKWGSSMFAVRDQGHHRPWSLFQYIAFFHQIGSDGIRRSGNYISAPGLEEQLSRRRVGDAKELYAIQVGFATPITIKPGVLGCHIPG